MLVIRADLLEQMVAHARRDHPHEACGQLVGPGGSDRPERYIPMTNVEAAEKRSDYAFDSREQLRVHRECEESGEEPIVVFHSHTRVPRRPRTSTGLPEAYPSDKDIEYMALQPGVHFVIVALPEPDAEYDLRSYLLVDGGVVRDDVQVVGETGASTPDAEHRGAGPSTPDAEHRGAGPSTPDAEHRGAGPSTERYMFAHTGADDVPDRS